jgi:tRNA U34 5-carboxymethylaminomethyl modifying GTPase MnmE/TrmE
MIVVAAKVDVANPQKLAKLTKFCEKRRYPFLAISAVTGEGIQKLKYDVGAVVKQMRSGNYAGPQPLKRTTSAVRAKKTKPASPKIASRPTRRANTRSSAKAKAAKAKTAAKRRPSSVKITARRKSAAPRRARG